MANNKNSFGVRFLNVFLFICCGGCLCETEAPVWLINEGLGVFKGMYHVVGLGPHV